MRSQCVRLSVLCTVLIFNCSVFQGQMFCSEKRRSVTWFYYFISLREITNTTHECIELYTWNCYKIIFAYEMIFELNIFFYAKPRAPPITCFHFTFRIWEKNWIEIIIVNLKFIRCDSKDPRINRLASFPCN